MKQIALAFPMGVSHLERVAYGIRRYNRKKANWLLITNPEKHHLELEQLRNWQGMELLASLILQKRPR